jgi:hypothetical protein
MDWLRLMTGNKRLRKAAPSPWKKTAKPASAKPASAKPASAKIAFSRAVQATRAVQAARAAPSNAQVKAQVRTPVAAAARAPMKKVAPAVFNDRRVAKRRSTDNARSDANTPVAKQLVEMSPLELRVAGLMREFSSWPHGSKSPPFMSTLLPDNLFPTSREVAKDQVREHKRAKERARLPEFNASAQVSDAVLLFGRNEASMLESEASASGISADNATPGMPLGDSPFGHSPFPSNPIHPLFPSPGKFGSDPSRYLRPGAEADLYAPRSQTNRQNAFVSSGSRVSQETLDAISTLFKSGAALLTGGRVARDAKNAETARSHASVASDDSSSSIALAMQRLSERQSMAATASTTAASKVGMSKVQLMNARAVARQARAVQASAGLVADNGNQPDSTEVDEMNISPSYVMDSEGEKRFFCSNGQTFANLRDLHAGLLMMKDEHFRHHVSEAKNDFAAWIKGVFGDQVLAAELSQVRSRALTAYKVGQRVRSLKK